MKRCPRCGIKKPNSEFYKDWTGKNGLSSYCRICAKNYQMDRRGRNRIQDLKPDLADRLLEPTYKTKRPILEDHLL
jgi:hypothetical protein